MAKNYDLTLKGFVGGFDFDAGYVDYILDKFSDREVSVLIDSLGGKTDTALSICAAFVNHGNVTVHFCGMNASAATIASMGAKKITIEDSATYLVHKCSLEFFDWSMKNADQLDTYIKQLEQHKEDLDKIDAHIAGLYARRCKKSPKDMLDLMKKGGWLTPEEAKQWGFVDEVVTGKEKKPLKISSYMASAMKEAGISVPESVAVEKDHSSDSFVKSVLDKISNLINSNKMDKSQSEQDHHQTEQQSASKPENSAEVKPSELDTLKAQHAEEKKALEKQVADLKAEIADLKKAPAEDSSKVVEDSKKQDAQPKSEVEQFFSTSKTATKLFNSIP